MTLSLKNNTALTTSNLSIDYPKIAKALFERAPDTTNFNRLRKRLRRQAGDTITRFGMVDKRGKKQKWLVCLSGGKDSHALLGILLDLRAYGDLPIELLACNLDQRQPGFPAHILPDYFSALGVPYHIETQDTYSIVTEKIPAGKTFCSLCSRLRRGILYRTAREHNCDAVVLGHHMDDSLVTFMMNLTHGGRLAAMPGKLLNDAGDVTVLRPLIETAESDLARYAAALDCPIIPCNLCGSQDGLERQRLAAELRRWEAGRPGTKASMMRALSCIRPSHLLDVSQFDFQSLVPKGDDPDLP